jgi:catechol 2,3-dioxygenase-like lactoylglutathione lyase family enzyme
VSSPNVAVPVLPVSDLVRSLAWYERLGFGVRALYEGYAIVAFGDAELHLSEVPGLPPASASVSGAYLRVADADAVHARWSAMGAPTVAPPEDQPYGIREFATEDLDGNLWRVGSPLAPELIDEPAEPPAVPSTEPPADGSPGTTVDGYVALISEGRTCAGCGLANGELAARAIGAQVRDEVHPFGELLARADDDLVRRRPNPTTWSALEYGVHIRDSLSVYAERIVRTLAEHDPELGWWDHEAAIEDGMANESDVGAVVDDLQRNAAKLSEALRLVGDDDWDRPATRRPGERMTIELLARCSLHEVVHHRADAAASLAAS